MCMWIHFHWMKLNLIPIDYFGPKTRGLLIGLAKVVVFLGSEPWPQRRWRRCQWRGSLSLRQKPKQHLPPNKLHWLSMPLLHHRVPTLLLELYQMWTWESHQLKIAHQQDQFPWTLLGDTHHIWLWHQARLTTGVEAFRGHGHHHHLFSQVIAVSPGCLISQSRQLQTGALQCSCHHFLRMSSSQRIRMGNVQWPSLWRIFRDLGILMGSYWIPCLIQWPVHQQNHRRQRRPWLPMTMKTRDTCTRRRSGKGPLCHLLLLGCTLYV